MTWVDSIRKSWKPDYRKRISQVASAYHNSLVIGTSKENFLGPNLRLSSSSLFLLSGALACPGHWLGIEDLCWSFLPLESLSGTWVCPVHCLEVDVWSFSSLSPESLSGTLVCPGHCLEVEVLSFSSLSPESFWNFGLSWPLSWNWVPKFLFVSWISFRNFGFPGFYREIEFWNFSSLSRESIWNFGLSWILSWISVLTLFFCVT